MTATAQKHNGAQRRLDDPARYRLEAQIGFVLRRAHQKATGIFNAVMGEFGVTPTHFAALAKLDDAGRVSQNELGRLTAMDPATVWGVVNRLMKQGFVAQSPDPDDARLVMVELTEAGRRATLRMKAVAAEVSRETLPRSQTRRPGSCSLFSAGSEADAMRTDRPRHVGWVKAVTHRAQLMSGYALRADPTNEIGG